MRYDAALGWLYARQPQRVRFGLDRVRQLLHRLEDPQETFAAFHVAGTNGKGSVSLMLEAALRAEGYRTGLTVSPHVSDFTERVQILGQPVTRSDLARGVERLRGPVEAMEEEGETPTFFEIVTALALDRFRALGVEVAVVEVGMGGRLDATNVVDTVVSVVTNVGQDHWAALGGSLETTAGEKAGILRPGVPAVTAAQGAARKVVEGRASQVGAPLRIVEPREARRTTADLSSTRFEADAWGAARSFHVGLLGRHQALNAVLAVRALEAAARFRVLPESAIAAWPSLRLPGRLETLSVAGTPWLLDGAHNPPACQALAAFLEEALPAVRFRVLFGALADKPVDAMLAALRPATDRLVATTVPDPRAEPADATGRRADALGIASHVVADPARALGILAATPGPPVLVTGSLYLVGYVRTFLEAQGLSAPRLAVHP